MEKKKCKKSIYLHQRNCSFRAQYSNTSNSSNNNPSTAGVSSPTATQTPTETDDVTTLNQSTSFQKLNKSVASEVDFFYFDKFSYTGTTNQPNLCLSFMKQSELTERRNTVRKRFSLQFSIECNDSEW